MCCLSLSLSLVPASTLQHKLRWFSSVEPQYVLNMDVSDIRNLMRKTQASILENGFLGFDDLKNVSDEI